jgi:heat shock protein HtpX
MIVQFGFFFGGGSGDDDDGPRLPGGRHGRAWPVYIVSFFLMQALSRYREYAGRPRRGGHHRAARARCDGAHEDLGHDAAHPADGPAGHSELNAFYIFPANTKQSLFNLFATHPPIEKRIAALQRLEAQLQGRA